jgi:tetratricopeptide (TPR) repeat protein
MHGFPATDAPVRRRPLLAVALVTVCGLAFACCVGERVAAQAPAAAKGVADDDPFADELNPFGTGKSGKPPAAPAVPAPPRGQGMPDRRSEPGRQPAADLWQEPDLRQERDRDSEPKPAVRPKPRPKLPVPFPEAPDDDDAGARRERMRGRVDRLQPGGMSGRPGKADDDAWLDQTEAEKMLADAEKLEQAGKLDEARDLLRQVVAKEPTLVVGHLALGVVLRRLGDFRGSVEACTKGIEVDPQESELYLRRGIAWFHQGLYGIALEDFEEAAGIAYEDPRPELWRGLTLVELDRPLEAINAYASAIRRDRGCMLAYLNRGLTYLATNEPGKAEFDFNQAIRHQPKDARVWSNRGVAQARQGRFREAIVSYETALSLEPSDAATRRNLEAARSRAGRPMPPSDR